MSQQLPQEPVQDLLARLASLVDDLREEAGDLINDAADPASLVANHDEILRGRARELKEAANRLAEILQPATSGE